MVAQPISKLIIIAGMKSRIVNVSLTLFIGKTKKEKNTAGI